MTAEVHEQLPTIEAAAPKGGVETPFRRFVSDYTDSRLARPCDALSRSRTPQKFYATSADLSKSLRPEER